MHSRLPSKQRYRHSRQRRVILEALRAVDTHPTADELYAMVRGQIPNISLGTVYRNLEVLARMGEIQRLEAGANCMRFDGRTDTHYHLRCLRCQKVVDAPLPPIMDMENRLDDTAGFVILGHRLEFVGLCPACGSSFKWQGADNSSQVGMDS